MSVDRYRHRKLHQQRQSDPLYIAAAAAVLAYAVTVAATYGVRIDLTHITLDVVTFGLFVPLVSFGVAWNETRPMFVGRVDYWREHPRLYRRLPGVICIDVAYRVVLYYAALPALIIGGISTGFIDRALWTYAFLALYTSIAYTVLAVALALWSRKVFIAGVAYVLFAENLLPNWFDWAPWLSIKQWAYASAHVLPDAELLPTTPIPTWAGWAFTYTLATLAIAWASRCVIREHAKTTGLAEVMRDLHKYSGTPTPANPPTAPVPEKRRLFRRGPPIIGQTPEPEHKPWPANPPPPTPPDLIADTDAGTEENP